MVRDYRHTFNGTSKSFYRTTDSLKPDSSSMRNEGGLYSSYQSEKDKCSKTNISNLYYNSANRFENK